MSIGNHIPHKVSTSLVREELLTPLKRQNDRRTSQTLSLETRRGDRHNSQLLGFFKLTISLQGKQVFLRRSGLTHKGSIPSTAASKVSSESRPWKLAATRGCVARFGAGILETLARASVHRDEGPPRTPESAVLFNHTLETKFLLAWPHCIRIITPVPDVRESQS